MKMLALDLFCKAGGMGKGLADAGFRVVGVDIEPQPHYPYEFIQGDALAFAYLYGYLFDFIHASPPCQFHSTASHAVSAEHRARHVNLIPKTRKMLRYVGKPYCIENVPGARYELIDPLMLHGSMFSLPIWRPRYFELHGDGEPISLEPPCAARQDYEPVRINGTSKRGKHALVDEMRAAMQIDWMTKMEIRQAVPPAFGEYIGRFFYEYIMNKCAA